MLLFMLAALLGMNTVLALGLVLLWRAQQRLKAENRTLRQEVEQARQRLGQLAQEVSDLEACPVPQARSTSESVVAEREIKNRLEMVQNQPKQMPDRYKAAVNMAGTGMDSEQIAEMLGLSAHETQQLASLAQISQPMGQDASGQGWGH